MADNPALLWRATLKRRLIVTASLLGLWSAGIQARLFYLQVVRHDALTADAQRQQLRRVKLPGRRGEILDRNGHVLARSVDMPTIKAYPNEIDDPEGTVRKAYEVKDVAGFAGQVLDDLAAESGSA